jgi:hypothetical protein
MKELLDKLRIAFEGKEKIISQQETEIAALRIEKKNLVAELRGKEAELNEVNLKLNKFVKAVENAKK